MGDQQTAEQAWAAAIAYVAAALERIREPDAGMMAMVKAGATAAVLGVLHGLQAEAMCVPAPVEMPNELAWREQFVESLRGYRRDVCASCGHSLADFHREGGCWHSVTVARLGRDVVCPCAATVGVPASVTPPTLPDGFRDRFVAAVGQDLAQVMGDPWVGPIEAGGAVYATAQWLVDVAQLVVGFPGWTVEAIQMEADLLAVGRGVATPPGQVATGNSGSPVRVDPAIEPQVVSAGRQLAEGHRLRAAPCPCCGEPFGDELVSFVLVGRDRRGARRWTGEAVAVHDDCAAPTGVAPPPAKKATGNIASMAVVRVMPCPQCGEPFGDETASLVLVGWDRRWGAEAMVVHNGCPAPPGVTT